MSTQHQHIPKIVRFKDHPCCDKRLVFLSDQREVEVTYLEWVIYELGVGKEFTVPIINN